MSDELFFFDGSGGCAQCQALTGCYANPGAPHENCDCPIYPCESEEDDCVEELSMEFEELVECYTIGRGPGPILGSYELERVCVYLHTKYIVERCCLVVDGMTTGKCWQGERVEEWYEHKSEIILEQPA